jgi:hypothetical protein
MRRHAGIGGATTRSRSQEAAAVISRVLAAAIGGYALANLGAVALVSSLPMARVEATMTALPVSFAVFTAVVVWAFAARSATAAWAGIAASGMVCAMLLALTR